MSEQKIVPVELIDTLKEAGIRVGHRHINYTVTENSDKVDYWGIYDPNEGTIEQVGTAPYDKFLETLIHELIHAGLNSIRFSSLLTNWYRTTVNLDGKKISSASRGDLEESLVERLADIVTAFVLDNPIVLDIVAVMSNELRNENLRRLTCPSLSLPMQETSPTPFSGPVETITESSVAK